MQVQIHKPQVSLKSRQNHGRKITKKLRVFEVVVVWKGPEGDLLKLENSESGAAVHGSQSASNFTLLS